MAIGIQFRVTFSGTEAQVQVVPQGIESVNGSNVAMGCTSPLVYRQWWCDGV